MFKVELSFRKECNKNWKIYLHYCDSYEDVIKYMDICMRKLSPKYSVFKFKIRGTKTYETER